MQKVMMLKPMQPGVSGYARLESEQGRTWLQVNARGLPCKTTRFFWYDGDGETKELGAATVNARGEASLSGAAPWNRLAPERLQALLLLDGDGEPRPLMIGLCTAQSAGSLLDAKNASLSLCEKLKRISEKEREAAQSKREQAPAIPPPPPPKAEKTEPIQKIEKKAKTREEPPREIFLPAIDPTPYVQAGERLEKEELEIETPKVARQRGAPVDALEPLLWPAAFASLQEYFEKNAPCQLFDLPGWRFVRVSAQGDGLWIGYRQTDGRVQKVAYAMRGKPDAEDERPYQLKLGLDGLEYRVLTQRA